jgi:hypothetical protein
VLFSTQRMGLALCCQRRANDSPRHLKTLGLKRWTERDKVWGVPLWARGLLVAVALGLLGLRLGDRDTVPYILDEAQFQDVARASVQSGTWPVISPVIASLGIPYGPGPVWFYTAVHHLVGPRPERSAMASTLFLSLTQLALAAMLARALGGGWLLFATLTALLATSPFLFFWSRLAWDVLAGYTAAAVALAATNRIISPGRGLLIGALLALALASHPMTVPLILAVLAVLSWEVLRRRSGVLGLLAVAAALVLVNVPYFLGILHETHRAALPGGPTLGERLQAAPARLFQQLLEPARVLTTTGVDYFFDASWPAFRASLGSPGALLGLGPPLALCLALLGAAGLLWAARFSGVGGRRVARIALLAWVGLAIMLSCLGLVVQPHYQLAAWWLIPAGVGALAVALLPRHPRTARSVLGLVWLLALANAGFDRAWIGWVRQHGGTIGIHYSVPMSAQREFLREACSTERPNVALANRTALFPQSLLSLAQTEPACSGKRVGICPGSCPTLDAQWRLVSLRYAAPPGGRLAPLSRP